MSKKHKQRSVLTDFYNLELSEVKGLSAPMQERPKIIHFFEIYAPEVLRYRTADEIAKRFPGPEIPIGDADFIGTLGHFEWRHGKSWFDTDIVNFYGLHRIICEMVDMYLKKKEISKKSFAMITGLTNGIRITLSATDQNGNVYGSANAPDLMNQKEYSFEQRPVYIRSDSSNVSKVRLGLAGFRYRLFREILDFWNGEIELRKCAFEGGERNPPCQNILVVSRRAKYCSKKCYDRARRIRRYRTTGK